MNKKRQGKKRTRRLRNGKKISEQNVSQVQLMVAKHQQMFTFRMSGELGFSSRRPEGLSGSKTGSGW